MIFNYEIDGRKYSVAIKEEPKPENIDAVVNKLIPLIRYDLERLCE